MDFIRNAKINITLTMDDGSILKCSSLNEMHECVKKYIDKQQAQSIQKAKDEIRRIGLQAFLKKKLDESPNYGFSPFTRGN